MVQGGAKRSRVTVYEDEPTALRAVLDDPATGAEDVILLTVHEDRDGVRAVLAEHGARPIDDETALASFVSSDGRTSSRGVAAAPER